MPDAATTRDLIARHHRRLYQYARALMANEAESESVLHESLTRIGGCGSSVPTDEFATWAEGVVREVAAERRSRGVRLPFSDDLFRQLADSAGPHLDRADRLSQALADVLRRLPPPERELLRRKYTLGLSVERIAAAEDRPASVVARDLTILHGTLVSTLHDVVADTGPAPPGGAADLGRMVDHLLDGTITEDSKLVLETLLLADPQAQAHYHRHVALTTALEWAYRGEPRLPDLHPPDPVRSKLKVREWAVTVAFVIACLVAAVFVTLLFTGQLKNPW